MVMAEWAAEWRWVTKGKSKLEVGNCRLEIEPPPSVGGLKVKNQDMCEKQKAQLQQKNEPGARFFAGVNS